MIRNKNIICISSIDWEFIWQGHQEIMSKLAKNGNRILFIENTGVRTPGVRDIPRLKERIKNYFKGAKGIRKEMENLYIFSPLALPFPYSRIARFINRRLIMPVLEQWIKIMDFNELIIWTFLPTPLSIDIIDNLPKKLVVYYCIDAFSASSASAKKIKKSEAVLLKKADLVFVTSKSLYNYCSKYNDKVYIFPFAVNFEEFEKARLNEVNSANEELIGIKRPIIGYIGGIHKWLDFNLIAKTAQRYPDYSFVFIGPIQTDISSLGGIKNIYFPGKKEHHQIPQFIKNFDVCIIPYLLTDYTQNVYPTKLNEYLAMGKPVVSTDLPEVADFNINNNNVVFVGKIDQNFMDYVGKAINDTGAASLEKRIAAAQKNSWTIRVKEMNILIKEAIEQKINLPFDWRESFLRQYRIVRRKFFRIAFTFLAAYFLVFYTPLVWFLAEPLKIAQQPEKSDSIVVFAGGVGESGKAGQGYEERVKYAVELYKKGYANYLIFSSGYVYAFKEPLVMQALAVSLGVPEEAILLEDRAKNTYENVSFSKEILEKNAWNKILVVSSPYHMRRVALVFNKIANNIKVIFVPIPNSLFYSHPKKDISGKRIWKKINIRQIKGIFHEYLGILYYWRKGWL